MWDLICEVLPALNAAQATLEIHLAQRWLYDERAQRAAETLAFRLTHTSPGALHEPWTTSDEEVQIFEEYAARLSRGTQARRWMQEASKRFQKGRRTRRKKAAKVPHAG